MGKVKSYSKEFKEQAVALTKVGGKSLRKLMKI